MDTLLLNADYQPLDILSWEDALSLLFRDKARVEAEYEDREVSSPSLTIKVPSVMVLNRYQKHKPTIRFSRANVYSRDGFECQYCGVSMLKGEVSLRDLTFDHVVPRSHGGATSWTNIVTSCGRCNRFKADRSPEQAGMPLRKTPRVPRYGNPVLLRLKGRQFPESWSNYVTV